MNCGGSVAQSGCLRAVAVSVSVAVAVAVAIAFS